MDLFFHELTHVCFSIIAGIIASFIVWGATVHKKQLLISLVFALIGGILIDLDHLFDYYIAYGFQFNLETFLLGTQFLVNQKIYMPFHGWEFFTVLLIAGLSLNNKMNKIILIALAFGIWFHLAVDTALNRLPPTSYSILYRLSVGFDEQKLQYSPESSTDILQ